MSLGGPNQDSSSLAGEQRPAYVCRAGLHPQICLRSSIPLGRTDILMSWMWIGLVASAVQGVMAAVYFDTDLDLLAGGKANNVGGKGISVSALLSQRLGNAQFQHGLSRAQQKRPSCRRDYLVTTSHQGYCWGQ
jgi:hypothetical protein